MEDLVKAAFALIFCLIFTISPSSATFKQFAPTESEIGCVRTSTGAEYRGRQNVSSAGRPCVRWDSLVGAFRDHIKMLFMTMPEKSASQAQNFCRNPNSDQRGLWCFVSQLGTVQFCSVPKCSVYGSTTPKARRPGDVRQVPTDANTPLIGESVGAETWSQSRYDPQYNKIRPNEATYQVSGRGMQNDQASNSFITANALYGDEPDPYDTSYLQQKSSHHGENEADETWPADQPSIVGVGGPVIPVVVPDQAAVSPSYHLSLLLASMLTLYAIL